MSDTIDREFPASPLDVTVETMSPQLIHKELDNLLQRIYNNYCIRPGDYNAAHRQLRMVTRSPVTGSHTAYQPLLMIVGNGTAGSPNEYLKLWESCVYWVGVFSEHEVAADITTIKVTTKGLYDVVIAWIRAAKDDLESFMAQYPGENIKHMTLAERKSLGTGFSLDMLRVNASEQTTITHNTFSDSGSKTDEENFESCLASMSDTTTEDKTWELVNYEKVDKNNRWTMVEILDGRVRCRRGLFNL